MVISECGAEKRRQREKSISREARQEKYKISTCHSGRSRLRAFQRNTIHSEVNVVVLRGKQNERKKKRRKKDARNRVQLEMYRRTGRGRKFK